MESTLTPAVLSGRRVNGVQSEQGMVVHVVRCSVVELKSGLAKQAYSLCGRTHGDKNDGWALCLDAVVTCPKCRKKQPASLD